MIKRISACLFFTSLLSCLSLSTQATHLMGGNLNYEYLGVNAGTGLYQYRVSITVYRYCASGSTTLPTSLDIGVYEDDPLNPTGDKQMVTSGVIPLITITPITPPNANDTCTFVPNVCVEEGYYEVILSFPSNSTGYYFISDRCCRNNNILNVFDPGNTGQAYYAFVPPPNVVNSSPSFAAAPVPFICASDTVSILNQAFDPDGDLLVYNFVTPYSGISDGGNPNPAPPATYPWPVPLIGYAATYSVANPFGPGGSATIDNATGLASYFAPNQGFYVLAVEIEEWRSGVLIGVTRRDLQIIVIPCPINPPPVLGGGSTQTNYTIIEGQTLCFSSTFNDPNGDSLYISHTGDIFNPLITNPAATFTDSSGATTATGNFCWTTSCDQGRSTPYQFSVNATDNGCPAKVTNIVYSITVENTLAPVSISGPDTICADQASGIQFTVPLSTGNTFDWAVTNGNITGPLNGSTITVDFTTPGIATISVVTVNPNGCESDTTTKDVYIVPLPAAIAGNDVQICSGGTASLGGPSTVGFTYSWNPATGLSNAAAADPTVTLFNTGATPLVIPYILTTNLDGCSNVDTVLVTVNPLPAISAGPDVSVCSDISVPIGSTNVPGQVYSWSPTTGLSDPTISDPILTLTNTSGVTDTLVYVVQVQNGFLCSLSDTLIVYLNPAPITDAGLDLVFCGGSSGILGVGNTPGYVYSWSPSTGLSSDTISNPTVILNNSSGVNDTVLFVLTTGLGACANSDTVMVIVEPSPVSNAGVNQLLCAGNTVQLGTTTTPGYIYSWSPATGLNDSTISDPILTLINSGSTPDTLYYVVTTTLNSCVTTDTVQVISGPAAIADAGTDLIFCSGSGGTMGTASTAGYTYTWNPATGLSSGTISDPTITLTNVSGVNDTIDYVVTANLFGCIDQDTVQVIVLPNPVSNAGPDQLLCSGNTIQLGTGVTPGYSYSWSPATGLNDSTISDPTLILTNTGTTPDTLVFVVTTTLNGCVTTDTVQVVSGPAPIADGGPDGTICSGQAFGMGTGGVAGYNYSWTPSTGLNNASSPSPIVTLTNTSGVTDTVVYLLTVDAYGCLDTDSVTIFVNPLPISEAGANTTICGGDSLVLGTSSTPGYQYGWIPASGLSNVTISNPVLVIPNTGTTPVILTYTVNTTLNNCTTTDSVTITINPVPVVTASASPASICIGDGTTLNASGATTYSWAIITAPQNPIGTGSSLSVTPSGTTTYIVTGTNGFSCSGEDTITVIVNPLPSIQITSATTSICVGDTLTLNASGASTYTWSTPGGGTIGTGASIQVSPIVNTTYIVSGTDSNLCAGADTINIIVNPAATANAIFGNASVCPGVTGVQYYVLNPNPTSTYTWSVTNGTIASGQGTDTIYVDWSSTSGNGMVTLIETTALGCSSPVPVTYPVSVNVILTPIAPTGPVLFCANTAQGITYSTLNTPGSVYNWTAQGGTIVSGNGSSTVVVDWTAPGPQTVLLWYDETSTTVTNVCFGTSDTLAITINPAPTTSAIIGSVNVCVNDNGSFSVTNTLGSSYSWIVTGANLLNGNGSNAINVNYPATGPATINVIETNSYGCIGDTVTLPITVNALPNADAGLDVGVCTGQAVQLNASGGVSYIWTPASTLNNDTISNPLASPTSNTYYSVLVTDAFGCKNSDSVLVSVNPLPVITLTPDGSVCIGNSFQLNADGGSSYLWSPASSLNDPGSASPLASPTVNTTYTVIVTDSNGCVDSASVNITVNQLPIATASADTLICSGSSTTLSAGGGVSYSWTPTSGLNNSTISNPVATPPGNTTYTVTVTDLNGCSDDAQVTVTLNDQPVASFSVDPNVITANCDGVQANLINTSQNANTYLWQFPDGTTSTENEPVYHFDFNTTQITLIAYNNICSDTNQTDYTGALLDIIFDNISNVFTPNGDGMNDCFDLGPNADFGDCSVLSVFNRWGNEVFHSSPDKPCWNGKKDGTGDDVPSGTYYISVHIAGHKYSGSVTLLR